MVFTVNMATTQEVWDHHVTGFVARDVPTVLEDFTDGSVLVANGELHRGRTEIGQFSEGLFVELPKDCSFDLSTCIVLEKHVYIVWNAESDSVVYEFAADTFAIEAGKITLQTIGYVKRNKSKG